MLCFFIIQVIAQFYQEMQCIKISCNKSVFIKALYSIFKNGDVHHLRWFILWKHLFILRIGNYSWTCMYFSSSFLYRYDQIALITYSVLFLALTYITLLLIRKDKWHLLLVRSLETPIMLHSTIQLMLVYWLFNCFCNDMFKDIVFIIVFLWIHSHTGCGSSKYYIRREVMIITEGKW